MLSQALQARSLFEFRTLSASSVSAVQAPPASTFAVASLLVSCGGPYGPNLLEAICETMCPTTAGMPRAAKGELSLLAEAWLLLLRL